MIFKKWINRYHKWREWRLYTWMGPVRQLLVLFNLIECTWFDEFIPGKQNEKGSEMIRPWARATDIVFKGRRPPK